MTREEKLKKEYGLSNNQCIEAIGRAAHPFIRKWTYITPSSDEEFSSDEINDCMFSAVIGPIELPEKCLKDDEELDIVFLVKLVLHVLDKENFPINNLSFKLENGYPIGTFKKTKAKWEFIVNFEASYNELGVLNPLVGFREEFLYDDFEEQYKNGQYDINQKITAEIVYDLIENHKSLDELYIRYDRPIYEKIKLIYETLKKQTYSRFELFDFFEY